MIMIQSYVLLIYNNNYYTLKSTQCTHDIICDLMKVYEYVNYIKFALMTFFFLLFNF